MKAKILAISLVSIFLASCNGDDESAAQGGRDINTADKVSVDRFSSEAATLMVRNSTNGLPGPNQPINLDQGPFITKGLDPQGNSVSYYNFDVQSTTPSPIYVFFREGEEMPVSGQNNIVATIPGDDTYSDFWLVTIVRVPNSYVPNSITSQAEVLSSGYAITATNNVVNCPVVPFGSTASRSFTAGTPSQLTLGWYKGDAVAYFDFSEAPLTTNSQGLVPTSPIYVMFNDNEAGPSSGFRTEENSDQTHNVIAIIPGDPNYSPLWAVRVLDNMYFDQVTNLETASGFPSMPAGVNVNCPVVK